MSHSSVENYCWITLQISYHQGWKDFCQKWKVNLVLRGTYRLSGTGIVECLEIVDAGCNLREFDGLTWLALTRVFYDRSAPLWMWVHILWIAIADSCWISELEYYFAFALWWEWNSKEVADVFHFCRRLHGSGSKPVTCVFICASPSHPRGSPAYPGHSDPRAAL